MKDVLEPLPEGTIVDRVIELWRDLGPVPGGHLYLGVDHAGERPRRRLVLAQPPDAPDDRRTPGAATGEAAIPVLVQVIEEQGQRLAVLDSPPGTLLSELAPVTDDELLLRLGCELAAALLSLQTVGGEASPVALGSFLLQPTGTLRYIGPVIAGDGPAGARLPEWLTALAAGTEGWSEEVHEALSLAADPAAARAGFCKLLDDAPTGSTVGISSDIGPARRRNEDSAIHCCLQLAAEAATTDLELVAVADGMGGHRDGDLASRVALSAFLSDVLLAQAVAQMERQPFGSRSAAELMSTLDSAFASAGETVDALAEQDELSPPGTTLVAALRIGRRLIVGNLGDSRAYLIRDGSIERVSRDDSYVQQLVDDGQLSDEEARADPRSHFITQYVGLGKSGSPSYRVRLLMAGDRVVLCSDGVCEQLADERVAALLAPFQVAQDAADALVWAAQEAGGTDNLTAVVLDLEGV